VGSYDMTGPATQAKLIYLLALRTYQGRDWSADTISTLLTTPLAGEMTPVNRLDAARPMLLPGERLVALDGSAYLENDPTQGPMLYAAEGSELLWSAISEPYDRGPGRLALTDTGELVLFDRQNMPAWQPTQSETSRSAVLALVGSRSDHSLGLLMYDATTGSLLSLIYTDPEETD
jgi:hypothetical protein